jgi:signal transduction histidine kinase
MRQSTPKRSLMVSLALIGCGLAISGWQVEEHFRFKRTAAEGLINRGRDITSTLGVVVRSQRRNGLVVSKERIQSALQDLIRPQELESIAILGSTGETIASAGQPVDLTPEMLRARGVYWRDHTLTIMNLMDLGTTVTEDGTRSPAAIVVADERLSRAFRPPPVRRQPGADSAANAPKASAAASPRLLFGRPSWMTREEYDSVIQKQGVHSLVISMSTATMHGAVQADLLLRSLVSLLAIGAAIVSTLAWRNLNKNAALEIRLVRAGEMNAHLKQMNLAAAGLAHETRNPLNLIRGLAQMIAMEAQSSPKLREHASTIVEEADRVTVQLNEFINYSKPREAHLAPVALARLVGDVARTLLPDIEEKQIRLVQPATELSIEADAQLLRQALFNVLLNAVQAVAPGGQIDIRWSQVDAHEARLEIADDGPGVPAAERASIFKPYVTMRPKGAGLGLAIVQQIASAHHWEVTCDANEPRGALFRFTHLKIAVPAA